MKVKILRSTKDDEQKGIKGKKKYFITIYNNKHFGKMYVALIIQ